MNMKMPIRLGEMSIEDTQFYDAAGALIRPEDIVSTINNMRQTLLNHVVDRLRKEYLHEKTGTDSDEAYDAAVSHCIGAVIAMIGDDYGESSMLKEERDCG